MIEDEDRAADHTPPPAANDNGNGDTWVRIDAAVLMTLPLTSPRL